MKKKKTDDQRRVVVLRDGSTHAITGEDWKYIHLEGRKFRRTNPVIQEIRTEQLQEEAEPEVEPQPTYEYEKDTPSY